MLTQVQKLQIRNQVQMVLHVPGNYSGGVLEMAIVIDHALAADTAKEIAMDLAGTLKQTDEVFRNVRLNLLDWYSDSRIEKSISALPKLLMGSSYEGYEREETAEKHLEVLAGELKKFYARSKLIILISDGAYGVGDIDRLQTEMKPFLHRKLLLLGSEGVQRYRLS